MRPRAVPLPRGQLLALWIASALLTAALLLLVYAIADTLGV